MTTRPESSVTFPGDQGAFHERRFVNRFDANTANGVQGIGSWRLESGGDWLASPVLVAKASGFGGQAIYTQCSATPNQPRLSTGTPGGTLYAVNPSTEYSGIYEVEVDLAGNTGFVSLDWYDAGEAFISRDESAGVALTAGEPTLVAVTATSPASAAFCRIRTRLTPAVADTQHWILRAGLNDGPSQEIVPSILITNSVRIVADVAPVTWSPLSVEEIVARWGAPGGLNAYMLRQQTDGTVALIVNVGGTQVLASPPTGKADGERGVIDVTRDHTTGDVTFLLDGSPLGGPVSGPAGDMDEAGGASLVVAAQSDGLGFNPWAGETYRIEVWDGTGLVGLWVPDEILSGSAP